MIKVRFGTFETNSSSVHAFSITDHNVSSKEVLDILVKEGVFNVEYNKENPSKIDLININIDIQYTDVEDIRTVSETINQLACETFEYLLSPKVYEADDGFKNTSCENLLNYKHCYTEERLKEIEKEEGTEEVELCKEYDILSLRHLNYIHNIFNNGIHSIADEDTKMFYNHSVFGRFIKSFFEVDNETNLNDCKVKFNCKMDENCINKFEYIEEMDEYDIYSLSPMLNIILNKTFDDDVKRYERRSKIDEIQALYNFIGNEERYVMNMDNWQSIHNL